METTCDVRDREAYIPPDADPDCERHWPPTSRDMAIEWAREQRGLERGLALDDDTLERVADAVMDRLAGRQGRRIRRSGPPAELYYTAEERQEKERWEWSRGGVPDGLYDSVEQYLNRHPEIDGGIDDGWRDGRRVLFVGIVGDAQAHRAALTRIGGDRVVLERRTRTVAELAAIADRIDANEPELAAAGLRVEIVWPVPERGVVVVNVIGGSDARAVAEFFAARYGEAVVVGWLGPSKHREVPHPFGSWTSAGRWLRVFFALDFNGQLPGTARVTQETAERIVVALSRLEPVGFRTAIGGFGRHQADVELREPVGARAVVDASAGVVRPSLAELGLPVEQPPVLRVDHVAARAATRRRRAQVWFSATESDAVFEAMVPIDDRLDEDGDPVVMPAVRRDVLDAIHRDIAESEQASYRGLRSSWVGDALVVERDDAWVQAFMPGPDGLYEVAPLADLAGPSQWVEVEPPLPDGPVDADTAVDLLSRVRKWYPTVGVILGRLEIDVLRAAHGRVGKQSIRDAIDDEIIERLHGTGAMVFGRYLRRLERGRSEDRRGDAHVVEGCVARTGREAILAAVPDAGERVLALARGERSAAAKGCLASVLGRLGYTPAVPHLVALLDDPHRRVRTQAAWALGALRAGEAASALRRMLATERRRPEPGHGRRRPIPTGAEAEAEARAALLAVTEGRYDPTTPGVERYPWADDE